MKDSKKNNIYFHTCTFTKNKETTRNLIFIKLDKKKIIELGIRGVAAKSVHHDWKHNIFLPSLPTQSISTYFFVGAVRCANNVNIKK